MLTGKEEKVIVDGELELDASPLVVGNIRPNDEPAQKRTVKTRHRIKGPTLHLLEAVFAASPRPSSAVLRALAAQTGEEEHRLRVWFSNRRGKFTRQGNTSLQLSPLANAVAAVPTPQSMDDVLLGTIIESDDGPVEITQLGSDRFVNNSSVNSTSSTSSTSNQMQLTRLQRKAVMERLLALQDQVRMLQGALQSATRETNELRNQLSTSTRLPPFQTLIRQLNIEGEEELKETVNALLSLVSTTRFVYASQQVCLRRDGQGAMDILHCISCLLGSLKQPNGAILIPGRDILRLVRTGKPSGECDIITAGGQRVRVEGVLVQLFPDGGLLWRAACRLQSS